MRERKGLNLDLIRMSYKKQIFLIMIGILASFTIATFFHELTHIVTWDGRVY